MRAYSKVSVKIVLASTGLVSAFMNIVAGGCNVLTIVLGVVSCWPGTIWAVLGDNPDRFYFVRGKE